MSEQLDENKLIALRREKLAALREGIAFPNDFRRDALAARLHEQHGNDGMPSTSLALT